MTVAYIDLVDYLSISAEVTGLDVKTLIRVTKLDLADSALHAPAAAFGGTDFYPDFVDKAAVLIVRLAKNHPLPDGNKRAAWVSLRMFIEINRWHWTRMPDTNQAEHAVTRDRRRRLERTEDRGLAARPDRATALVIVERAIRR